MAWGTMGTCHGFTFFFLCAQGLDSSPGSISTCPPELFFRPADLSFCSLHIQTAGWIVSMHAKIYLYIQILLL